MTAAPGPFADLGSLPIAEAPAVRWHVPASGDLPAAAIVGLGVIQVWTYSEDQAAALEAAFAEARRLHREAGGQS